MGKIDLNYLFMDKDERMEFAIYEATKGELMVEKWNGGIVDVNNK